MGVFTTAAAGVGSLLGPVGTVIGGLAGAIGDTVSGWYTNKQEMAKVEHQSAIELKKAKTEVLINLMREKQIGDIAWENTALQNAGWKDEYWTILLSIPFILCFIPVAVPHVSAGFQAMETMPAWYQWMVSIAISVAFGYCKVADWMGRKNGVPYSEIANISSLANDVLNPPADKSDEDK